MLPKSYLKCQPLLVTNINKIMLVMNLQEPINTIVFTCLTTIFFSYSWLGEFTVLNLKNFSSQKYSHITKVLLCLIIPLFFFFISLSILKQSY